MAEHWARKLQAQENEWRVRIGTAQRIMREQRGYLAGPKFQGDCEDNVGTHEVFAMFERIEAALTGDPMGIYGDSE